MPSFTRRAPGAPRGAAATESAASASTAATPAAAAAASTPTSLPGTRPSPSAPGLRLLPSGIGSLDDVLGGGLPLGSTLLLLAPDAHTAWSRLVARHVAAQGAVSAQRLIVLSPDGDEARAWAEGMPWLDPESKEGKALAASGAADGAAGDGAASESEGEGAGPDDGRTRIAWRYDSAPKFQTTVGSSSLAANLTVSSANLTSLINSGHIVFATFDPTSAPSSVTAALVTLAAALDTPFTGATRVAVPDLASPAWGSLTSPEIHRFLVGLRSLLRPRPAAAVVTLPPRLSHAPPNSTSPSSTPDATWIRALAHSSDACLELTGFGSDPALAQAFHPAHGLLKAHALPGSHHVLAPALRHSTLLGVGGSSGGAGENNLGFRLKRKRFVIETVHLGIEGGTSERRTGPAEAAVQLPVRTDSPATTEGIETPPAAPEVEVVSKPRKPRAKLRFADDEDVAPTPAVSGKLADLVRSRSEERRAEAASAPAGSGGEAPCDGQCKERGTCTGKGNHAHGEEGHGHGHKHGHGHGHGGHEHGHGHGHGHSHGPKRVAIQHDRPELYEF